VDAPGVQAGFLAKVRAAGGDVLDALVQAPDEKGQRRPAVAGDDLEILEAVEEADVVSLARWRVWYRR
jgi:hypothetical protein